MRGAQAEAEAGGGVNLVVVWSHPRFCLCKGSGVVTVHPPKHPYRGRIIPCPHCTSDRRLREIVEEMK